MAERAEMGVNDVTEQSQAGRAATITSAISACSAVNQAKGIHLALRPRQDQSAVQRDERREREHSQKPNEDNRGGARGRRRDAVVAERLRAPHVLTTALATVHRTRSWQGALGPPLLVASTRMPRGSGRVP